MRTDPPTPRPKTADRLRAEFARARRRFKAQPSGLRWAVAGLALAALAAMGYSATVTTAPAGVYVRSGERFAADELITVRRALDRAHLRYRVDDQNRVEVAADQLDASNDAVAKLDVGPRTISEIEEKALGAGILDSIAVTRQRQERARCAKLEAMIRPIDGVVSAHVDVNRPRPRNGFGPPPASTAFVLVETEKDRELSSAAVESIQGMVAGMVPDVRHDAVSVFDRKGRHYSDALDPVLGAETRTRHRRDALRHEILDKLDWLNGADVSVQFVPPVSIPPPNPVLPPLPPAATATTKAEPPPAPPSRDVEPAPPSMIANQPLELPTEVDEPARNLVPPPLPAPAPVVAQPAPGPLPPPRAKVWVKVPRSYYLKAARNREPSLDDLQPFVDRTKGLIETAVRHVVPAGQLDEPVVISTIPDESASPPPPLPSRSAAGSGWLWSSWWVSAAVAAVAAGGGGLTIGLVLAARRPALRNPSRSVDAPGRYTIDEPTTPGPGPSERVRELIRLNPEAAASVLHRWTGQGGAAG